jgi:acetolactate synthase-1/2/3 large subunit
MSMSVAHGIYEVLRQNAVSRVYCVPGESFLALLNEFADPSGPDLVTTRHEEGAGLMAEAHAKLTGEVGTVLVTRGPGLTHLAIALHTAKQDSTPLVAFVGQVPTGVKYREAFQELDITLFGASVAKWSVEISNPDRAVELVEKAYRIARSGRPGPVVISLPEDIDRGQLNRVRGWEASKIIERVSLSLPSSQTSHLVSSSGRPTIIVGRPVQGQPAVRAAVEELALALDAPVYNAWRRFDAFDNCHTHFAGNIPILSRESSDHLRSADVVILVDDRLDEFTSLSYAIPNTKQNVVMIGGERSGMEKPAEYAHFLNELASAVRDQNDSSLRSDKFRATAVGLHCEYTARGNGDQILTLGATHPASLAQAFAESLPSDAIVTSDAGTFASWLYRACSFTNVMRFLGPTAGGMGYALPSAIAARMAHTKVPVYAIVGDGGFAMTMSELETGRRHGLEGIGIFVFDNEMYGTIAAHQDRYFPGRRVGIELGPIDYRAVASGFGWEFRSVTTAEDIAEVVNEVAEQRTRILAHVPISKMDLNPLDFSWPERKQDNENLNHRIIGKGAR